MFLKITVKGVTIESKPNIMCFEETCNVHSACAPQGHLTASFHQAINAACRCTDKALVEGKFRPLMQAQ
jgi:hypothetical protein